MPDCECVRHQMSTLNLQKHALVVGDLVGAEFDYVLSALTTQVGQVLPQAVGALFQVVVAALWAG